MAPQKITSRIYKISGEAIANERYSQAIRIIERYAQKYILSKDCIYRLALLHDHVVMRAQEKGGKKRTARVHLYRAEELYRKILKEDPRYLHAWYGIGRVFGIRGDYTRALMYGRRAFQLMRKLPKKERGALGIGFLYEQLGDIKNAEAWYQKEYRACPKNDFGTISNLFRFYVRIKNFKKALLYAIKTEELIKREFRKKVYRGLRMKQSHFITSLEEEIKKLKTKTRK